MATPRNTPERLRATWSDRYVVSDRGCHEWLGSTRGSGYGSVSVGGRILFAHRVAYELFVGPIPEGMVVRHRVCDNPCCVNPAHLELGTQSENVQDMMEQGRWGGPPRSFPGPDWPIFLRKLNQLGISQRRLAKKFGVSRATIQNTLKR